MKRILQITLAVFMCLPLMGQELFHRVRIDLYGKNIQELGKVGIEVDHGHIALGRYIENDYSESEIEAVKEAGFKTEILIEDMSKYYREQLAAGLERMNEGCLADQAFTEIPTPENFTLGTMGGLSLIHI